MVNGENDEAANDTSKAIILLKSPSPNAEEDVYARALTVEKGHAVHFVPVLRHTLRPDEIIKCLLNHLGESVPHRPFPYGGLVITSQRAVAALSTALASPPVREKVGLHRLQNLALRIYTVGPATARAVQDIKDKWLLNSLIRGGKDAGNGDVLADLILNDYSVMVEAGQSLESPQAQAQSQSQYMPLLFLSGEKHRDVIPRKLQADDLPIHRRIRVDEMIVYESAELDDFSFSLQQTLNMTNHSTTRWFVVFSPSGGRALLDCLGWLDHETSRVVSSRMEHRRDFICCIGPTTQAYLQNEFDCTADVVATKPSSEAVQQGIRQFLFRGIQSS